MTEMSNHGTTGDEERMPWEPTPIKEIERRRREAQRANERAAIKDAARRRADKQIGGGR